MNRFYKTTFALFKKDIKDSLRNPNVALLLLLPLMLTLLYRYILSEHLDINMLMMFVIPFPLAILPNSILAMTVAEEKEKNTLRTLMLSGVTAAEFITSKVLVTLAFLLFINLAVFLIIGLPIAYLAGFLLITSLGAIPLFLLGVTIGIVSRNQMSTGVLTAPVMFLFLFPAILSGVNPTMELIGKYTPISNILDLCLTLISGQPVFSADTAFSFAVLFGWTVLSALLCTLAYRRKKLD